MKFIPPIINLSFNFSENRKNESRDKYNTLIRRIHCYIINNLIKIRIKKNLVLV